MILSSQLINAILQILVLVPFVLLAKSKNWSKEDRRTIGLFVILYILWTVLTSGLSGLVLFDGQLWNWLGKAAGLLMSLFFVIRSRIISRKEAGLQLSFAKDAVFPVVMLVLFGLLLRVAVYFTLQTPSFTFNKETLLFQSTINVISDEVFFRGILLVLLGRIFKEGEDFFGFSLSWPVLITSILFGLSQGLLLQNGLHLQINLIRILLAFLAGLIAAMLKERSGSLLPAVVFHALWNLTSNH
ncbi:CPBP family intramembrane glutamic endopeptidase [Arcticibacter sp. MXS-1]|uniref:CPBP family intramembrane glutamic endopeptidase n=1 Tax=Arcticibacter sp. MXS-1 TaxID=3341726 RepID=UPI0035A8FD36